MSSSLKLKNGAIGKLSAGINTSATTLVLMPGDGSKFPALTAGQWFPATIIKATGEFEIVKVTARASDVLTVVRAQESTLAQSFLSGDRVELRFTAGAFTEEVARIEGIAATAEATANAALPKSGGTMTGPIVLPGNPNANLQAAPKQYVDQQAAAVFPSGGIIMWSGSIAAIPAGWFLCNGANGTPDLRDRFIIGARQDQAGSSMTNVTGSLTKSGGSKDAIVVAHAHTGATELNGSHTHTVDDGATVSNTTNQRYSDTSGNSNSTGSQTTSSAGNHAHTFTTNSTGSSGTNANLPPYFALAFIMKG